MGRWGFFLTVEGIEGSGKTTLALGLKDWLISWNLKVEFTREPGGTPPGEAIREILSNTEFQMDGWTEVFLFLASRRENVIKIIRPALQSGKIVISDRFSESTFAYQVYGRGLPYKIVSRFNKKATLGLVPDLTFLIDVPPQVGLSRIKGKLDRIEGEQLEFHQRVREGYLKLAKRAPKRIRILNGGAPLEEILNKAIEILGHRLLETGYPLPRALRKKLLSEVKK
jgi:dTMP kinase